MHLTILIGVPVYTLKLLLPMWLVAQLCLPRATERLFKILRIRQLHQSPMLFQTRASLLVGMRQLTAVLRLQGTQWQFVKAMGSLSLQNLLTALERRPVARFRFKFLKTHLTILIGVPVYTLQLLPQMRLAVQLNLPLAMEQ